MMDFCFLFWETGCDALFHEYAHQYQSQQHKRKVPNDMIHVRMYKSMSLKNEKPRKRPGERNPQGGYQWLIFQRCPCQYCMNTVHTSLCRLWAIWLSKDVLLPKGWVEEMATFCMNTPGSMIVIPASPADPLWGAPAPLVVCFLWLTEPYKRQ